MDDVRRRLDLGRAGPKVREVEDGVIKSLDKLIKEMEDSSRCRRDSRRRRRGNIRPSLPRPTACRCEGKGPGKVDQEDIGHESGWGDLPAKQRRKPCSRLARTFPPTTAT